MAILQIKEVSKFYANHTALNKVSFNVPTGRIFGLLGPNGAGKTSLIRIINQITAPDEGEVVFDGEHLAAKHIAEIGYLPEERGLYKKMTVADQLIYFARLRGLSPAQARGTITHWLTKFDAIDWQKRKIEELSKGMQQKIQFIATVMHQPKFIILDEPFTGFDPKNTQLIKDEILKLKENGASIMLSTHRMENVEAICDDVVLLNKAKVVVEGTVKDVRNSLADNTYEVVFEKQADLSQIKGIIIKESFEEDGITTLQFNYPKRFDIRQLLDLGIEVRGFREVIPSMQDVFIKLTDNEE